MVYQLGFELFYCKFECCILQRGVVVWVVRLLFVGHVGEQPLFIADEPSGKFLFSS